MNLSRRRALAAAAAGLLPLLTAPAAFSASDDFDWSLFKQPFFDPEGRIVDVGNGGVSHSEGQGYGMLLAEASGDRAAFDKLWSWTAQHLACRGDGLLAWRFAPGAVPPVADPNNATDGDVLVAWALLRAGGRWRDKALLEASETIRAAILRLLVKESFGRIILLPGGTGFESPSATRLNLSYYVWPALDAFRREDGDALWGPLIDQGLELLAAARFGEANPTPDWIELGPSGAPVLAASPQSRFGFDAIRIPLHLAWSGRDGLAKPFADYWAGLVARNAVIPAWIDLGAGVTAPYPLSAGGLAVVRFTLGLGPTALGEDPDYYSSALANLTMLARRDEATGGLGLSGAAKTVRERGAGAKSARSAWG